MALPTDLPGWTAAGTEPPAGKKSGGWGHVEKPPAGFFNWLFKTISDWCSFANDVWGGDGMEWSSRTWLIDPSQAWFAGTGNFVFSTREWALASGDDGELYIPIDGLHVGEEIVSVGVYGRSFTTRSMFISVVEVDMSDNSEALINVQTVLNSNGWTDHSTGSDADRIVKDDHGYFIKIWDPGTDADTIYITGARVTTAKQLA